jgi:hypothetical protein
LVPISFPDQSPFAYIEAENGLWFPFSSTIKVGAFPKKERRLVVAKYIDKKRRRTYNKRVNYDCRKRVAEKRMRIKGRFVTKEQAMKMLGVDDLKGLDWQALLL